MAKRITDVQRLEEIMNRATLVDAYKYLEICGAILRARFPQAVKTKVATRKAKAEPAGGTAA